MKKIAIILFLLAMTHANVFAERISIRVTSSTPIYGTTTVRVPYVYYEEVPVRRSVNCDYRRSERNSIGLDTIIGAGLGIALGNQIGGGNGRTAAKVILGAGGAYTANNMRSGSYDRCSKTTYRTKQFTEYEYVEKDIIIGYRNCGYVGNRKICKQSKRKKRHIYLKY